MNWKSSPILTIVALNDRLYQAKGGLVVDLSLRALHAIHIVIRELPAHIIASLLQRHRFVRLIALDDACRPPL